MTKLCLHKLKAMQIHTCSILHYGHLNVIELRLLKKKDMVIGLPEIYEHEFCEGCVY